ncbi:MAG: hypothetical protein AAFZ18_20790 [Myxococcota bacterium]
MIPVLALLSMAPSGDQGPRVVGEAPVAIARALVEALHEGEAPSFPPGAGVALRPEPNTAAPALIGAVLDALPTPLETLGARVVSRATNVSDARAAGAEWLLSVGFRPAVEGTVIARLEEIDRGPFEPLQPRLVALAELLIHPASATPRTIPLTEAVPDGPTLGRPLTLLRWPRPVWAVASCPGADDRDHLLIAEANAVHLVDLEKKGGVRTLPLEHEPRADEPVRAPFASLRCGPPGDVGFGHGRLENGLVLGVEEGKLTVTRRLPGWPIGYSRGWWTARVDRGRRRFAPLLHRPDDVVLTLEAPLVELAISSEGRLFGVDEELQLRRLTATGAFGLPVSRAGVGLGLRSVGETLWVVATGPDARDELLLLVRGDRRSQRALTEPALSAAVGRPRGRWVVMAAVKEELGARILAWPLPEAP